MGNGQFGMHFIGSDPTNADIIYKVSRFPYTTESSTTYPTDTGSPRSTSGRPITAAVNRARSKSVGAPYQRKDISYIGTKPFYITPLQRNLLVDNRPPLTGCACGSFDNNNNNDFPRTKNFGQKQGGYFSHDDFRLNYNNTSKPGYLGAGNSPGTEDGSPDSRPVFQAPKGVQTEPVHGVIKLEECKFMTVSAAKPSPPPALRTPPASFSLNDSSPPALISPAPKEWAYTSGLTNDESTSYEWEEPYQTPLEPLATNDHRNSLPHEHRHSHDNDKHHHKGSHDKGNARRDSKDDPVRGGTVGLIRSDPPNRFGMPRVVASGYPHLSTSTDGAHHGDPNSGRKGSGGGNANDSATNPATSPKKGSIDNGSGGNKDPISRGSKDGGHRPSLTDNGGANTKVGLDNGGGSRKPSADGGGRNAKGGSDNGGGSKRPSADVGGGYGIGGPDNGGGSKRPSADGGGANTKVGLDNGGGSRRPSADIGGGNAKGGSDNGGGSKRPSADGGGGNGKGGSDNGGGSKRSSADVGGGYGKVGPDNGGGSKRPSADGGGGNSKVGLDNGGGSKRPSADIGGGNAKGDPNHGDGQRRVSDTGGGNAKLDTNHGGGNPKRHSGTDGGATGSGSNTGADNNKGGSGNERGQPKRAPDSHGGGNAKRGPVGSDGGNPKKSAHDVGGNSHVGNTPSSNSVSNRPRTPKKEPSKRHLPGLAEVNNKANWNKPWHKTPNKRKSEPILSTSPFRASHFQPHDHAHNHVSDHAHNHAHDEQETAPTSPHGSRKSETQLHHAKPGLRRHESAPGPSASGSSGPILMARKQSVEKLKKANASAALIQKQGEKEDETHNAKDKKKGAWEPPKPTHPRSLGLLPLVSSSSARLRKLMEFKGTPSEKRKPVEQGKSQYRLNLEPIDEEVNDKVIPMLRGRSHTLSTLHGRDGVLRSALKGLNADLVNGSPRGSNEDSHSVTRDKSIRFKGVPSTASTTSKK